MHSVLIVLETKNESDARIAWQEFERTFAQWTKQNVELSKKIERLGQSLFLIDTTSDVSALGALVATTDASSIRYRAHCFEFEPNWVGTWKNS
jgi:hypothetical protein